MPYDEQGNFYGSDEDLSALEAKYTKPDYASMIPGGASISKAEPSKTLREQAVAALMQANPFMLQKSFQDAAKTVVGGGALPVVAPISAGVQALNALPGNLYRRYKGEEEVKTPSAEELMQKYGQALEPQTPMGRGFQEGIGKLMDTLKVPAAWPVGVNAPRRPVLTPTDVRVGAGQIKQLAKELREVPQDFQAAQSGLKRQNLYGEDTLGVKTQAAADALGDVLERRRTEGKSLIPGVPGVLTPDTKMYAVRPAKSTLTRPKMTEGSEGFIPEVYGIEDIISEVYGDTPVAKMPSSMVMGEYSKRFLPSQGDLAPVRQAVSQFTDQKIAEMYPDAPDLGSAKKAYNVAFNNREKQTENGMRIVNEFFETPEGQAIKEQYGVPSPAEFLERYGEAERVIKGPFANFISRNVGAEGDAIAKLARKGITIETPEQVNELGNFINKGEVAQKRVKAGFPAMGSFHEEYVSKTAELDALNEEIQKLEDIRRPIFERAHAEDFNPSTIPEYAETTNPLRQKLREREKLQEDIGNIKTAQNVENINDSIVKLKTTEEMLKDIPYEQRQFYPSVTRAQPGEMHYTAKGNFLKDSGFEKLGKDLVEDILTGKAGDTSKLTIENFIRDKHLTRVEAEKAAKAQQQAYRQNLESVLLQRLQNDSNVKSFGNASIITLDKNTPRDVALRDVSTDTFVLDHCVGQGGTAPSGRKNIVTNQQQYYEPIIDPVTGERNKNVREGATTSYVNDLEHGAELASVRDSKTGFPVATIQLNPTSNGKFNIGYASGAKNGAVDPQYSAAIKDYLNSRTDVIDSPGSNLADNTGVFDIRSSQDWRRVTREAKLSKNQVDGLMAQDDLPRFVTVDDVKKAAEGFAPVAEVATVNQPQSSQITRQDYNRIVGDFSTALDNAAASALENSGLENPDRVERRIHNVVSIIFDAHMNDQEAFMAEPATRLQRIERQLDDRIQNMYAQGDEFNREVAAGLEDFIVDVRGMRSDLERRARLAEERAAQQLPVPAIAQDRPAPAIRNEPMPGMSADELLAQHGERMTPEQRNWLQNFIQMWDDNVDTTPAGQGARADLEAMYDRWVNNETLPAIGQEPAAGLAARDVYQLAEEYQIPPAFARNIQTLSASPLEVLETHLEDARTRGAHTRYEGLPADITRGISRMLEDMINERQQQNRGQDHGVPEGLFDDLEPDAAHPANNVALQVDPERQNDLYRRYVNNFNRDMEQGRITEQWTPEELADFIRGDDDIGTPEPTQADREALARLVEEFGLRDNFEPVGRVRQQAQQLPAPQAAPPAVQAANQLLPRNPVPREVQTMAAADLQRGMTNADIRRAQEIADQMFRDNTFNEEMPIGAATNMLRSHEAETWRGANNYVREQAARHLEAKYAEAQRDAANIAETLEEAFYGDEDNYQASINAIRRDISDLERRGDLVWEDLVGPMAEDIPWNPTLQSQLIQQLENLINRYENRIQGYAKGGRVQKAPGIPLVLTRRSPELTEMAYRYGGMV